MPVARGSSNPIQVQTLGVPRLSTPVDQQADSTAGGGDEGEVEDERKYCFCDRVSYGEMIGCDDTQCEREWVRVLSNFLQATYADDVILCLVPPTVSRPHNPSPGHLVLRAVQGEAQQSENQPRGKTQGWWWKK